MDPEELPKLKGGFYLLSGFFSTGVPEKRPPPKAGFLSSSLGVGVDVNPLKRDEEGLGLVFEKRDPVLDPNKDPGGDF